MSSAVTEKPDVQSFDVGEHPRHKGRVVFFSLVAGFLLTVVWSATLVDKVIGENVADTVLGYDADQTHIPGVLTGIVFAFVSGVAGTFTACNVAVMGVVAPLVGGTRGKPALRDVLKPVGWIAVGIVAVSATYGVVVALVGTRMPQFATTSGGGISPRTIQSMIAFGLIGAIFIYLGLVAVGVLPDVLARVTRRFPATPQLVMGALIGGFLIGRPYPLFRVMFRSAAESGNPLYGAGAFVLQSLGNIVVMTLLVLVLGYGTRGRLARWLAAKPGRIAVITGAALLVVGAFTLLYWDLRPLGRADLIWYPRLGL